MTRHRRSAVDSPPRLLVMVTSSITAEAFLGGQLRHLAHHGFEVVLAAAQDRLLEHVAAREGVRAIGIRWARDIDVTGDAAALARSIALVRRERPHATNVGTPKAGLLGGLAAVLCRVPARVYTLHGLRLEGASGAKRALLWVLELLACRSAHRVVCVSPSLRSRALRLRLVAPERAVVLGAGSSNGIDVARFAPKQDDPGTEQLRRRLGLGGVPVVGFVGRLTNDKGIAVLAAAWQGVRQRVPDAVLVLVGGWESGDPVSQEVRRLLIDDPRVHLEGHVQDTAPYYRLFDLLVLPTFREGFPYACLEAAASGVPVVTTDATGAVDAVRPGETGLVVPVRDVASLADAVTALLTDPARRQRFGRAARAWVLESFTQEQVWEALREEIDGLLRQRGLRTGA